MSCNGIEINSDSDEVIKVVKNGGNSLGPSATIYEECTFLYRNLRKLFLAIVLGKLTW
jgi:hypothetical protein